MRASYKLFRGSVNPNMSVLFSYDYATTGQFQTITRRETGSISIMPSFGINISNGFDKDRIYITAYQYYSFASLLKKTVNMISEHLYEIFPNAGRSEFEIDNKTLDRFQVEKAMSTDGMTMVPIVYVDDTNQCFPGVLINTLKFGSIRLALQDAISMSKMFDGFDPYSFSLAMCQLCRSL